MKSHFQDVQEVPFIVPVRSRTPREIYFKIVRPALVECLGVFFLVFLIHASGAIIVKQAEGEHIPVGGGVLQVESLVTVFAFIGIFSFTRPISGGHLNPVITVIWMVTGKLGCVTALFYVVGQIVGSILGGLCVKIITDIDMSDFLKHGTTFGRGPLIFAEFMGSMAVILAFLKLASKTKGNAAVLGIGFTYAGALIAVHSATYGFLNPVINFGIAVAVGEWDEHYVYWVGPYLGGIVATLLHGFVFAAPEENWLFGMQNMPESMNTMNTSPST